MRVHVEGGRRARGGETDPDAGTYYVLYNNIMQLIIIIGL